MTRAGHIFSGHTFSERAGIATSAAIGIVGETKPTRKCRGNASAVSWRTVLVLVLASAAIACTGGDPEPGAVRLAALTADAAADVLSDLAAVDDPDAAGVRDAFLTLADTDKKVQTAEDGRPSAIAAYRAAANAWRALLEPEAEQ